VDDLEWPPGRGNSDVQVRELELRSKYFVTSTVTVTVTKTLVTVDSARVPPSPLLRAVPVTEPDSEIGSFSSSESESDIDSEPLNSEALFPSLYPSAITGPQPSPARTGPRRPTGGPDL
jgi:hypothetical protein